MKQISFGSDNHSGVHPRIIEALVQANSGHQGAYGSDAVTRALTDAFQKEFACELSVFPVFTGTAANTLAIRSLCQSFEAVVAASCAHLNEDECGAPEFVAGNKILSFPHRAGKLSQDLIPKLTIRPNDPHRVVPKLLSLTQATELGTVYSIDEIKALSTAAHSRGMLVHMDGARMANAAATLGCRLAEMSVDAGVDVLSFGGTKNGLLCAEAVVFFRKDLASAFPFHRKQSMQLASKMRYLSCQFLPYLQEGLWLTNAQQANRAAQHLRAGLSQLPDCRFPYATEANEVFAILPEPFAVRAQQFGKAYLWDADSGLLRFVTSWDTDLDDVDRLLTQIRH